MAQYRNITGEDFLSRLASWKAWRDVFGPRFDKLRARLDKPEGMITRDDLLYSVGERGLCPFCNGVQAVNDKKYGQIYCICYILQFSVEIWRRTEGYRSMVAPSRTLDEIKDRNDNSMKDALTLTRAFIDDPKGFLTFRGAPGIAKSDLLMNIAVALEPWAMYLVTNEFEEMYFDALNNNRLSQMTFVLSRHPILLLDDWGSEHMGKTGAVQDKLRSIINWRYAMSDEYPLVVASNLQQEDMKAFDPRVYSRLRDTEKGKFHNITVSDYRPYLNQLGGNGGRNS